MANPTAAISVANAAMQVLQNLSRPGSAMAAMLSAQWDATKLIVEQLNEVQHTLATLLNNIDELAQTFAHQLETQALRSDLERVQALAQMYAELVAAAAASPDFLAADRGKDLLQFVLEEAKLARASVTVSKYGRWPEASLIVPIAFAMEVSAMARSGYKPAEMLPTIQVYEHWTRDILSADADAIHSYQLNHLAAHDATVAKAAETRLGKATGVGRFRGLGQEFKLEPSADACFLLGDFGIARNETTVPPRFHLETWANAVRRNNKPWIVTCLFRDPVIQAVEDESLGVGFLQYQPSIWRLSVLKTTIIEGDLPPAEYQARVITTSPPAPPTELDAVVKLVTGSGEMAFFDPDRVAFEALVEEINYRRGCIGYAQRASIVAQQTAKQISRLKQVLRS